MLKVLKKENFSNLTLFLIIAFPLSIVTLKIFGNLILFYLLIVGVIATYRQKINPYLDKKFQFFSLICLGYFLIIFLSIFFHDGLEGDYSHLGRKIHFLFAPFIFLVISQADISINKIINSVKLGLIILGLICIYQFFNNVERPSGMINPNVVGDLTSLMLFISLTNFFTESASKKILTFIAFFMGLLVIILSGSRGSWLSFIFLSFTYFLLFYKSIISIKLKSFLTLIFLTLSILIFQNQTISQRSYDAIHEIASWNSGIEKSTSSGIRLDMWKAGLEAFKDAPVFGYGFRNENKVVSEYSKNNKELIRSKTHLHNEYITHLVSAGMIGLVAILVFFIAPLRILLKYHIENQENLNSKIGVLVIVGYMTFGLTHISISEEHLNAFYIFFMSLSLSKVGE